MSQRIRVEGYAVVSADGMLADRDRKMPDSLKIDADAQFFTAGLERAALVVHGRNRNEALMRLRRALDEFIIDGVETTLPLFRTLVRNSDVQNGQYDIHWLEQFLSKEGADEDKSA